MTVGGPALEFPEAAAAALQTAASQAGLSTRGARLIRLFGTAVYHLPADGAVARIAQYRSPETVARLAASVQVTRWLTELGFPAVEPLAVDQPVASYGCVVTFWVYLPQDGAAPGPADLGRLLRQLHQLPPPPVPLPVYKPLASLGQVIHASRAISDADRDWLLRHRQQLLDAYAGLAFDFPVGLMHGDAWRGNLLRDRERAVLADWDNVAIGPRETDLIPTLQASRFGLPAEQRDAFIAAYGRDIRGWDGYPVMLAIRELSTLSALLRDGHASPDAAAELRVRIRSIRSGDDVQWMSF
jgi:aminoglycoside phosphotransferase